MPYADPAKAKANAIKKQRAYRARMAAANPNWYKERNAKYYQRHSHLYKAGAKARSKRVKQATPKWADVKGIVEFYVNCPEGHDVDHIVPLKATVDGVRVASGLHVIENLQYLPKADNDAKGTELPREFWV